MISSVPPVPESWIGSTFQIGLLATRKECVVPPQLQGIVGGEGGGSMALLCGE